MKIDNVFVNVKIKKLSANKLGHHDTFKNVALHSTFQVVCKLVCCKNVDTHFGIHVSGPPHFIFYKCYSTVTVEHINSYKLVITEHKSIESDPTCIMFFLLYNINFR